MIKETISVFKKVFTGCTNNFLKVFSEEIIPLGTVFYSFEEDKIAAEGFVFPISVEIEGETYSGCYLYGLCTLPEFRKQGRMSLILEEIENKAKKDGLDFTFLATDSCEAIRLYNKHGYRELKNQAKFRGFLYNSVVFQYCPNEEYLKNTRPTLYPSEDMRKAVLKASEEFLKPAKCKGGYFLYNEEEHIICDYFTSSVTDGIKAEGEIQNHIFLEDKYRYFIRKLTDMPDIKTIDYILD